MIRKKESAIIACILLFSIVITINTGCRKQTQNLTNIFTTSMNTADSIDEKPPATWENLSWMKNTSPVRMSVFIDEPYALAAEKGWGNDVISKEVTRLTGVSLDVYSQAVGSATAAIYEKDLDTLLASDNLTDFVFTDRNIDRFENISICYPWDELIPQNCPELFDLIDPIELLNNVSDDGHIYTLKTEYKDEQVYRDENSLSAEYGAWNLTYRADVLAGAQLPLFVSVEALDETLYAVQRQGTQWGLQAIYYRDPGSISALAKYMGCPTEHYWDADQKRLLPSIPIPLGWSITSL